MAKSKKELMEMADELSAKMRTSLTIQNSIHLADRKREAGIGLHPDERMYFDPKEYAIHLGIYGPLEIFQVEKENDYVAALEFLYGHENQHVRSTATKPYDNGIKRGVYTIIEYIAAKEGIRKNFRNERDYEVFVQQELPKHGIYLNFRAFIQICAYLMNSIEDGRIERIRSLEFPGFEKQRRYFRAWEWKREHEYKPYSSDFKAEDLFNVYLMAAHSLATTGLYPKGFVAAYANTPIMDEVHKLMPYIGKAVLSKRTRQMADNVVEMIKVLAPCIYEMCKIPEAQYKFEQMMQQLMSSLAMAIASVDMMADTSEREEEIDDGIPNSVFPQSNLVITLKDEEYDELMKKMKEKGKEGNGGIMVRREHPLEEDKSEENNGSGTGSSASDTKDKDKDTSNSQSGSGSNNEQDENNSNSKDKADTSNSSDSEKMNENGSTSATNNNSSDSKSNGDTSSNEKQPYDKTYQRNENGSSQINNANQGNHQSGGGENGTDEMVEQAMEEAAKECRDDVTDLITSINQSIEHTAKTNRGNAPIKQDNSKPITNAEVKDICSRFEEKKRKYKLDEVLPPMLNARAKSFRKKNERYFKSLSTPNVSHLDSGSVDPTRIFGLAMGETDIFRKKGTDKQFDGCVYILVDNSGSMSGNKRTEACKAAAVIEEGFKGIIPMKIVAFDTCGKVIHEVIKGWDESQKLNCCWNFAKHGRSGCGNDDNKDILIAQRELMARPEEKKLLIVLSDGAPGSIEDTKQAIDDTRKKGINVYGIYFEEGRIGDDAKEFQYMYTKDYVCCELAEVDAELTKLMIKFSRS